MNIDAIAESVGRGAAADYLRELGPRRRRRLHKAIRKFSEKRKLSKVEDKELRSMLRYVKTEITPANMPALMEVYYHGNDSG